MQPAIVHNQSAVDIQSGAVLRCGTQRVLPCADSHGPSSDHSEAHEIDVQGL